MKTSANAQRLWRQARRKAGNCGLCFCRPAERPGVRGFTRCLRCKASDGRCRGCAKREPTPGYKTCARCRNRNRARVGHAGPFEVPDDSRVDRTPGCSRCGLRGSHECIPESAVFFAAHRKDVD